MTKLRATLNLLGALLLAFVATTCVVAALAQESQYPITCRYVRVLDLDTLQGTLHAGVGPIVVADAEGNYTVPRWPIGVLCIGEAAP